MKYSNKVLINEEKNSGSRSTKNMYGVADVNAKQGPRTGNAGTMSKRSDFKAAKEERAPLADVIANAFGARAQDDHINPKLEPIASNSNRKFKK
jgi:hypothetical protein